MKMLQTRQARNVEAILQRAAALGSAAAVVVAREGEVIYRGARGVTRRWDAANGGGAERTPTTRCAHPVSADTRFDLASVTKPIVAAALLVELDRQGMGVDLAAAEVLPEFRNPSLGRITVAHLLSHTAGFAPEWTRRRPDPYARVFRRQARPNVAPGGVVEYSCVGYIWAGLLAEELADRPLPQVVESNVLGPLGMSATGFAPALAERSNIPATEDQPGRGMVQGEVHDETSFELGGATGNAGLFGSANDLLTFLEALRCGVGEQLPPGIRQALVTPVTAPPNERSYGMACNEEWMAPLGTAAGHRGFTGTAIVTQPEGEYSVVFLTNRVHPTRSGMDIARLREELIAGIVDPEGAGDE